MSLRIVLESCIVLFGVLILVELIVRKRLLCFVVQAAVLLVLILIDLFIDNAVTGRIAFREGVSPLGTVGIMFVGILFEIAALQKSRFSLLDFLKPMAISPILLFPLIGRLNQ